MNILQLPFFLIYKLFPAQSNDLSFGLIQDYGLQSILENKNWLEFDSILKKQSPENLTKLIDGLCLTRTYKHLISSYLKEHHSEVAILIQGVYNITIAWQIRTGDVAKEIKVDQWEGFFEYLRKAEDCLNKVIKISTLQVEAKARLIYVYMGLSRKQNAIDTFNQCIQLDPNHFLAHLNMFKLLTPKWLGNDNEVKDLIESVKDTPLKQLLEIMYLIEIYSDLFYEDEEKAKFIFWEQNMNNIKRVLNMDFNLPNGSIVAIYTCNYLAYLYHIIGKRRSRNKVMEKIEDNFTSLPWEYFGMHSKRDVQFYKMIDMM